MTTKTLYFGYGSNLWKHQMAFRCPENKFVGTARLPDWRWIINKRGYANVVPSKGDQVWAFLYELSPSDEVNLDGYEGVPDCYVKQTIPVEYFGKGSYGEMREGKRMVDALVYVDVQRTTGGWPPKEEYIHRMNCGIADALEEGVSRVYITEYLRPSIPDPPHK
ncbi:Butirosin biosynthesis, BtrG-like protein [Mycena maculata]|uniref:gamma-glutamylcyclotransferase n=1 Tax=Mycena maculata TaxID=230809 RepID=A0AAD7IK76_9AGAR|nr:Butirosin biosynthesis, BtrG-like protein [Mycena maculata]